MSGADTGGRIAAFRRQRGMSQRDLAAEMKRSESWVSQVERGIQPVERLSVLQELADALGVTVFELRPEALPATTPPAAGELTNDLDGARLALSGHPTLDELLSPSRPPAVEIEELTRRVDELWELTHASQFAALSEELSQVLPKLELAARARRPADEMRAVHALRARAYQAASATFARQDEPDAAWVAGDRAIQAAELAGNPLDVVAAHFRLAHAFMRLRRLDQADYVTSQAIEALRPRIAATDAPPEMLSLYGAMHLVGALVAGREGDRAKARRCLAVARKTAQRLGADRNDFGTEFGPANVLLHQVAVAVDLGDAGEALDVAAQLDASGLSSERQSRYLLDVARAHTQRRHIGEATAALLEAEALAPEHIRSHNLARSTTTDLLNLAGRRPTSELVALAERIGVNRAAPATH